MLISGGNVLMPNGGFTELDILVEEGKIAKLGDGLDGGVDVDASGALVLPGLIDLHMHGLGMEFAGPASLDALARLEARFGATSFYPSLFAPPESLAEQLIRYNEELPLVPQVPGFRLESPYLAVTGGGNSGDTAPISDSITDMLLAAGSGDIKIWDVSPELPGAADLIGRLAEEDIVCSLAHTNATIEQAHAAVDAGARLVTHLFDVFSVPQMTDPGVYPAGLTDYLLVEDRLVCEIIADGTHVHPVLVEVALRCKNERSVVFVTDSNMGAGLPSGEYDLPNDWGPVRVDGGNNGVRLVNKDLTLCGSALTPIDAFRNAMNMFGRDIAAASRLCSTNPADVMRLNKGRIAPGLDADLIVLTSELELLYTVSAGTVVYKKP